MKKKDKKKNIKHFLYEDSKKDTFLNPTKWKHLEAWAQSFQLTLNEVVEAMREYSDKHDRKKFNEVNFKICDVLEKYIQKKNCSVNHAIDQCADTITEILGDDDWNVNTIDEIHRRIVKENPKRWAEWQDFQNAHIDLNK
jgi:uracil DNA glycosylase